MVRARAWMVLSALALAAVGVPVGQVGPVAADPVPAVTVERTGLVDYDEVEVTGTGFEPFTLYEIFQCRGGAVGEADCDANNADFVDSDGAGEVHYVARADARIYLPDGTEVDCRTDPAGCEIGIGFLVDADEWPAAPLDFDPTAPLRPVVEATVDPSDGLDDGAVVAVEGLWLSPREEGFAYLCATGSGMPGSRCDLDRMVREVPTPPDGAFAVDLTVFAAFSPPLGGTVDCRTAPDGCEVVVSWGFTETPDRIARVPVAFSPTAEPTTTTTTAAPPPTSSPPPAAPVDTVADFTG